MKNIESLSVDISKYGERVIDNLIKAQSDTAYVIQQEAKYLAPVNTGKYRDSIQLGETTYDGNNIKTQVYTEASVISSNGNTYNLGQLLEEGTSPHIIEPVNAKVLHFQIMGEDIFIKRVYHPGTISQPHFIPALQKNVALYKSNIRKAMKEA
ncbi:HK97 gp10 family phage protein [bacterium]|nr:HK97 gp10 family phage protein [bacterium]